MDSGWLTLRYEISERHGRCECHRQAGSLAEVKLVFPLLQLQRWRRLFDGWDKSITYPSDRTCTHSLAAIASRVHQGGPVRTGPKRSRCNAHNLGGTDERGNRFVGDGWHGCCLGGLKERGSVWLITTRPACGVLYEVELYQACNSYGRYAKLAPVARQPQTTATAARSCKEIFGKCYSRLGPTGGSVPWLRHLRLASSDLSAPPIPCYSVCHRRIATIASKQT